MRQLVYPAVILASVAWAGIADAAPKKCIALLYKGECLGWKARPFAFSPGGQYLYFVYQYVRIERGKRINFTLRMIGRYDFRRKTVRIVRSTCDTDYKSGALSRDGRFLAMHAQVMGRYKNKYRYVREESLEILDLKTGVIERVRDRRFKEYRNIVFSPDDRRVYFSQRVGIAALVERLAVYDRRTSMVVNLYPKILKSSERKTPKRNSRTIYTFPRSETYWLHRTKGGLNIVQYVHLESRTGNLTFVGRLPFKFYEARLRPLARQYGVDVKRLKNFRLVYSLDTRNRTLALHPVNQAIIKAMYTPEQFATFKVKRFLLFGTGRGVHSFVPMPSGRSYLVFHKYLKEYSPNTKLRVLKRGRISDVIGMPWFANEFVMSRDEKRVAHNFWHFSALGRFRPKFTSIIIRNLGTGSNVVVNPGALANALLAPVAARCRINVKP
ncbi:MAG: hypothetical protein O7I42_23540 [Alphaproteobacteria bacterium]|nr:hypothetical protein [Alphaproteobacteria bacterium]